MIYRDATPTTCPRCRTPLSARGGGHGCATCEGLFIDEAELRKRWERVQGAPPFPVLPPRLDRTRRLPCPACGTPMDKVILDAIDLDRCDAHGIWLDGGELERAVSTARLAAEAGEVVIAPFTGPIRLSSAALVADSSAEKSPERAGFEMEATARLNLIDLELRDRDEDTAAEGLRRVIALLELGRGRWPDARSIALRLEEAREVLVALDRRR